MSDFDPGLFNIELEVDAEKHSIRPSISPCRSRQGSKETSPETTQVGSEGRDSLHSFSTRMSDDVPVLDLVPCTPRSESATIAMELDPLSPVGSDVGAIFDDLPTRSGSFRVLSKSRCLGKYEWKEEIGQGGYGVVTKALNTETGCMCAIKSTSRCSDVELVLGLRLKHPHIVEFWETFRDEACYYYVMPLCTGGSLTGRVEAQASFAGMFDGPRGLPQKLVAKYIWEMLSSIAYLHHYKIAHRDCKPENYLRDKPSDDAPLKLIDFGLSVLVDKDNPPTERVGTIGYAAPEVTRHHCSYTEKCDIWSIGAVSYYCCVGLPPYGGNDQQFMRQVSDESEGVPFNKLNWDLVRSDIKAIVQSMVEKDPNIRPSAKELAEENERMLLSAKRNSSRSQPACCTVC